MCLTVHYSSIVLIKIIARATMMVATAGSRRHQLIVGRGPDDDREAFNERPVRKLKNFVHTCGVGGL